MRKPSHEQQWLTAIQCRSTLATEEKEQLNRLKEGLKGERYLDWLFEKLGPKNTVELNDLTLKHEETTVQIDKIFLFEKTVYLLDAKAYHGTYTYDGRKWHSEAFSFDTDIFHQLDKAQNVVENIFEEADLELTVEGYLVFTETDLDLTIPQHLKNRVLLIDEVASLFRKLAHQEKANEPAKSQDQPLIDKRFAAVLKENKQRRFRTTRILTLEQMPRLTKGIFCENCHSFDIHIGTFRIICKKCHHRESKEKAFTRTICDCGLIFHKRELTVKLLRNFLGKDYEDAFIHKILKKHFPKTNKSGTKSSYTNKGLPMYEWMTNKQTYFQKTERKCNWKDRKKRNDPMIYQ